MTLFYVIFMLLQNVLGSIFLKTLILNKTYKVVRGFLTNKTAHLFSPLGISIREPNAAANLQPYHYFLKMPLTLL